MSTAPANERRIDPDRYHETVGDALSPVASAAAICLYLEATDRRNLLRTTCPRIYQTLEPDADMSWEVLTRLVDHTSNIARRVVHGIGGPMLVKELPRIT